MPPDMVPGHKATLVAFLPKDVFFFFNKIHFIYVGMCECVYEHMHICVLVHAPMHVQRAAGPSEGAYRYLRCWDLNSSCQVLSRDS